MTNQATETTLRAEGSQIWSGDTLLATCSLALGTHEAEQHAARMVACTNALQGIANPEAVAECIAVIREIATGTGRLTWRPYYDFNKEAIELCLAALAKLEGRAS